MKRYKILERNEYGTGILLEYDAGFVSTEDNQSVYNTLNENFNSDKKVPFDYTKPPIIKCVLQKWGVENKNGRIYPQKVLMNQFHEYQKIIKNNSSVGEMDHPEITTISLKNITHLITDIWWGDGSEANTMFGNLKLILSPGFIKYGIPSLVGDIIAVYLMNDIKIGISSRGVGSVSQENGKTIVQSDFELIGFDLVSSPSTIGAYLLNQVVPSTKVNENINKETYKKNNLIDKFILL